MSLGILTSFGVGMVFQKQEREGRNMSPIVFGEGVKYQYPMFCCFVIRNSFKVQPYDMLSASR